MDPGMISNGTESTRNRKLSSNVTTQLKRPIILGRKSIRSRIRRPTKPYGIIREDRSKDESFFGIVLRVSFILLSACMIFYVILWNNLKSQFRNETMSILEKKAADIGFIAESGAQHTSTATEDIFNDYKRKKFDNEFLPQETSGDCFDIADMLPSMKDDFKVMEKNTDELTPEVINLQKFIRKAKALRADFSARYGGEIKARAMLSRGLNTFHEEAELAFQEKNKRGEIVNIDDPLYTSIIPIDIIHTANRILTARFKKRPFKMTFGGYSVTVGRGNYFHQSYPFVMKRILEEPMKLLGVDLYVRNAAIGGIPSFPYGFCLDNFLGEDTDVVSWDYSMNESGGVSAGIEAYLRQTLTMKNGPLFIVKDTHMAKERKGIIRNYVKNGSLKDPIIIHTDPAAEPYLREEESLRPPGFQKWREFGAPKGAPGQARHHPSVKEHELIGWLLAMHFLAALEIVYDMIIRNIDIAGHVLKAHDPAKVLLPPPFNTPQSGSPGSSLLFGEPVHNKTQPGLWSHNHVSCRTTFDPTISGSLDSIIVSGVTNDLDPMLTKSEMIFREGWVLDFGEGERRAKRKLKPYDGLGYIDSKKAYYGLPMSGPVTMRLPWDGFHIGSQTTVESKAKNWFKSVVVCEVNEERDSKECKLDNDVEFTLGGQKANNVTYMDAVGISYLSKKICVNIPIPSEAEITKNETDGSFGLILEAKATAPARLKDGPCSISHVVWEEISK